MCNRRTGIRWRPTLAAPASGGDGLMIELDRSTTAHDDAEVVREQEEARERAFRPRPPQRP